MGRASRHKQDRRDGHRRRPATPAPDPVAAPDEAALLEVVRAIDGPDLSLGAALVFGLTEVSEAIKADRAPEWFDRLDVLDILFLGAIVPEIPDQEHAFANARDAWLGALRDSSSAGALDDLVEAMVGVSETTGLALDDPEVCLALGVALAEVPSCLVPLDHGLSPRAVLAGHRAIVGPAPVELGPLPEEGLAKLASFKGSLSVGLANDGSLGDAFREGMAMLKAADALGDPMLAVAAFHLALTDDEHTSMAEVVAVTPDWSDGLDPDSALTAVVDTIWAAAEAGEDLDSVMARVLARPELAEAARPSDRVFHARAGWAAARAALARPGTTRVRMGDGDLLAVGATTAAVLRSEQRAKEALLGRPMLPHDHLLFDTEAGSLADLDPADLEDDIEAMLDAIGASDQASYVYQTTGLLPPPGGKVTMAERQAEIDAARKAWMADAGYEQDEADEIWAEDCARMNEAAHHMLLAQVVADPDLGADVCAGLAAGSEDTDLGPWLVSTARHRGRPEPATLHRAGELARAWQGAELAASLSGALERSRSGRSEPSDAPALLALAVADLCSP
ncbi:MAG: hypothetical protein ACRD0J_05260 [Acidimicrobiales bacterium]